MFSPLSLRSFYVLNRCPQLPLLSNLNYNILKYAFPKNIFWISSAYICKNLNPTFVLLLLLLHPSLYYSIVYCPALCQKFILQMAAFAIDERTIIFYGPPTSFLLFYHKEPIFPTTISFFINCLYFYMFL